MDAAVSRFEQALAVDPHNATALYRLGKLALDRGDHASAVALLTEAHDVHPGHRGVAKRLGYALVWQGELKRARTLLAEIPEAPEELDNYVSWWRRRGANELALRAQKMALLLSS